MNRRLFVLLFLFLVSCSSTKRGVPCTYAKVAFVGDLVSFNTGIAKFRGNDGKIYLVPFTALYGPPSLVPGRLYKVQYEEIVQGTCKPIFGTIKEL